MNASVPLPDPDQRPMANVVLFDGDCRFCRAQVSRLARLDVGKTLAFLSLHDPRVTERYPDLTYDQLMAQMYVIDPTGGRHGGAAALRYLSRRLPALWLLAPVLHIPFSLPIWGWLYNLIARHRYRWGKVSDCENGTCAVHFAPAKKANTQ